MASLSGLHFCVTRPGPQGALLCELISAQGGSAFHFPTLTIVPSPHEVLTQAFLQLGPYQWWIFTSPQAVYSSAAAIRDTWACHGMPKWAAVGAGTAKALRAELGVDTVLYPEVDWSSEGLLALPEFQAVAVAGKKLALIRGVGGRAVLESVLTARGASVLSVIAYERTMPSADEIDIRNYLDLLRYGSIQGVISTSYEGTRNLKHVLTDGWSYLKKIPLIVPGQRVKMLVQELGFEKPWVVCNASHASVLTSLADRRFREFCAED